MVADSKMRQGGEFQCLHKVQCSIPPTNKGKDSSTLKMEATDSPRMPSSFYHTTWHHIPEHDNLKN